MTKTWSVLLPALAVCGAALADAKLADRKNCLACHAVDKKVVGPALKEVASRYAGQADAPAKLAVRIKGGSNGVWGNVPMPPNDVTDAEAQKLAEWVLTLK
jgi:cytochrome c